MLWVLWDLVLLAVAELFELVLDHPHHRLSHCLGQHETLASRRNP